MFFKEIFEKNNFDRQKSELPSLQRIFNPNHAKYFNVHTAYVNSQCLQNMNYSRGGSRIFVKGVHDMYKGVRGSLH